MTKPYDEKRTFTNLQAAARRRGLRLADHENDSPRTKRVLGGVRFSLSNAPGNFDRIGGNGVEYFEDIRDVRDNLRVRPIEY